MDELRDHCFERATLLLGALLLPVGWLARPGRGRELAAGWALRLRFREDLGGLTAGTRAAFAAARTEAFWRHGRLVGLSSGHRDPAAQQRLWAAELRRSGSAAAARMLVLPPAESSHVRGVALDVRPREGARWLEEHGGRFGLHRTYDNEWWHFEHHDRPPARRAHPGAVAAADPGPAAVTAAIRSREPARPAGPSAPG
jgi:zinc D-Ala-D-Ala carboxypeptidase